MRSGTSVGWILVVVCLFCHTWPIVSSIRQTQHVDESQIVSNWADKIGKTLYKLADTVVKPQLLLTKYKNLTVRVVPKHGEDIIRSISINVARMLSKKMDAVKCLYKEAERISEEWEDVDAKDLNVTYYSAKFSNSTTENGTFYESKVKPNMFKFNSSYMHMYLEPNTHFNDVAVNVTHSAVHTPTNVHDQWTSTKNVIMWSERMDRIFKHNYKSDPALTWQYFCSMTGVLRQFPAMRWPFGRDQLGNDFTDIYDCRVRSWFIEAATCSKDVVILVDNSGSMYGMSNTIDRKSFLAKSTVSTILSTLSNNDYVAVLSFTNATTEVVPCFRDMLVQATPENLRKFNDEVSQLKQENPANLTTAFIAAFDLLSRYRNESRCGPDMSCNQLIMLVTDGIASNITEIFEQYNWLENGTMPVRVFTYLIGKEVSMVREIQWMACLNRGYYAHIHTQAEVPQQVLKYIAVVARPLVLHAKVHPVVWTHAYVDIGREENEPPILKDPTFVDEGVDITELSEDEILNATGVRGINWRDRLLTSVSIPVFDRKGNAASQAKDKKRQANLLGVVGTDIPLKDIRKLTLPYKLGVNGYAFIVSNNGYVVLHPALKPDYQGELKLNYNSIDLTEVEILNDDSGPRKPGEKIKQIREALVNHTCGSMKNVEVKLHYDDSRRVTLENRDYFYAALPLTPFGIAVVLPQYGRYYVKGRNEIDRRDHNISDYFLDNNWGVHPEWVYCRYHYLEGHEFETPEKEIQHFLKIVSNFSLSEAERFPKQYKNYENTKNASASDDEEEHFNSNDCEFEDLAQLQSDDYEPDCGSVDDTADDVDYQRHHNDHYCNKELMELLVMDAIATHDTFSGEFDPETHAAINLTRDYGVFLRFMATQSGLTRWQTVKGYNRTVSEKHVREFAKHKRALDEPWYKGAILQNEVDPDSVSVTVPVIRNDEYVDDSVATISMGIFPRDDGHKAAAGVAGIQLPVKKFYEQFISLTSLPDENDMGAEDDTRDKMRGLHCSDPAVDCYLIDQNGYIVISEAKHEDAGKFFGSLDINAPVMKSLIRQGLFTTVRVYDYLSMCHDTRQESAGSLFRNPFTYTWNFITWFFARLMMYASQFHNLPYVMAQDDEPDFSQPPKMHKYRTGRPCDMVSDLYIINKDSFDKSYKNENDSCALPFYAHRVPFTNLILVVVKTDQESCYDRLDVTPHEIPLGMDEEGEPIEAPCHKLGLNNLYRRRLKHCYTQHDEEIEIEACGEASGLALSFGLVVIVTIKCLLNFS